MANHAPIAFGSNADASCVSVPISANGGWAAADRMEISASSADGQGNRCLRLNKECRPSTSVRKRRAQGSSASQTAHLEEKLGRLVTLLHAKSDEGRRPNLVSATVTPATAAAASSGEALTSNGTVSHRVLVYGHHPPVRHGTSSAVAERNQGCNEHISQAIES